MSVRLTVHENGETEFTLRSGFEIFLVWWLVSDATVFLRDALDVLTGWQRAPRTVGHLVADVVFALPFLFWFLWLHRRNKRREAHSTP